ncbi:predicted protein [Plenodomus lingam JN3]|uniref:Predicted protein n=1 Tax=Leptosphaeria maculans (strain JN3 / isolate v23.1.3 / race Av1-4-5-6-7-8) TaxID=985895 RepID=E5AFC9_LEPMJ|nr:predicted protein [Plenodomus lingam JN3]CBY01918.1 predicted protein [Plenodomus lingam JN3]
MQLRGLLHDTGTGTGGSMRPRDTMRVYHIILKTHGKQPRAMGSYDAHRQFHWLILMELCKRCDALTLGRYRCGTIL